MDRAELFRNVLAEINRKDKGEFLPEWLATTHFRINEALRHEKMVRHSMMPVTERIFPMPPDFIEIKGDISIRGGSVPQSPGPVLGSLYYMPSDQVHAGLSNPGPYAFPRGPLWFTTRGNMIELGGWNKPGPFLVDLWYYAKLPELKADTDTNWLLTDAPHIYKDGMAALGFRHLKEYDISDRMLATMLGEIQGMNDHTQTRAQGTGPLIQRSTRGFGANVRRR